MRRWVHSNGIVVAIGGVVCALVAVVVLSAYTIFGLWQSIELTEHSRDLAGTISSLRIQLAEAEGAKRGYIMTGEQSALNALNTALDDVVRQSERLQLLTKDDRDQTQLLTALEPLLDDRVQNLRAGLNATLEEQRQITREGLTHSFRVRSVLDAMQGVQSNLLAQSKSARQRQTRLAFVLSCAGAVLGTVTAIAVIVILNRQMGRQAMTEARLRDAFGDTSRLLDEAQMRNKAIGFLSELSGLLQACRTSEELYSIIENAMGRTFPAVSGSLGLTRASRNAVVTRAAWGPGAQEHGEFAPDQCWALRRGQIHVALAGAGAVRCTHVADPGAPHMCVPLAAQGETLGVLTFVGIGAEWASDTRKRYAETLAETIGMAMANLELRERLMNQAITDQLTGLFNRRYMEETLARELKRAERGKFPVSVILLDIDHFKQFNDTYGHQAGDEVLRVVGQFLKSNIRSGDFAARYGGEEFAVVLAGSPLRHAVERADSLREGVKRLSLVFAGESLGKISLSLGVASAPEQGIDIDTLLRAADSLLYDAKRGGRDRVCAAASGSDDSWTAHAEGI